LLAACGNELLTAPPEAAVPADTVARVHVTSSSVIAGESKTPAAGPLVMVDGGILLQIEALGIGEADIASIEVIKGASAASLYGSRGCTASVSVVTKVKTPGAPRR
jgi:TonB-dependent SusC/RagA subfamily outer membrane receptor